jgi:hypothetical protein
MPIDERHGKRIQGKAQKSFALFRLLGGKFDWIRGAGEMEMSSDGGGENDGPQTAEEEFARINGNGDIKLNLVIVIINPSLHETTATAFSCMC